MADETVSVAVTADNRTFVQSFNQSAQAVKNLDSAAKSLVSGFRRVGASIQSSADAISGSLKKMAIVGAAGIGGIAFAAAKGIKNFSEFESGMANVSTVADTTTVSMKTMGDAVMSMTGEFPQSAEELAAGLYEVNSAGFQGAKALTVLQATAKLSTAGLIDMTTSVRGTTAILNAYGLGANQAAHVTDVIFKAVEVGQMTAQEFTQNIGDWAAAASSLGVPFESASAALATMTTRGALPAMEAATSLQAIFRALIKPTDDMSKTITRAGFGSGKAMLQTLGLAKTLNTLWEASGKNEEQFANIFQETTALNGALGLVNSGYEMLVQSQADFNNTSKTAGTVQNAFNQQMDTFANRAKLFGNELRQVGFEMGKMAAPIVNAFLEIGTTGLKAFNSLPEPLRGVVATLQLLAPALAVAGGLLAANAIKTRIWTKTFEGLSNLPFMKRVSTEVLDFTRRMAQAGGPVKFVRAEMLRLATANNAVRAAFLRTLTTVTLFAAAVVAAGVIVATFMNTQQNAKAAAEAYTTSVKSANEGQIKSMQDLNDQVTINRKNWEDFYAKSGGNSLPNRLLAGLQGVVPFITKTKQTNAELSNAAREVNDQMELLANTALLVGQKAGLGGDQALAALDQLSQEGTVDLQKLTDAYKTYLDMRLHDPKVKDLIEMQNRARDTGQPAPDPRKFLPPETAAQWKIVNDIMNDAATKIGETNSKMEAMTVADKAASASAEEFAKALFTMGDSASVASEKLDAFNTIQGQLLGNTVNMRDVQSGFIQSLEKAGQAMVDNGANFNLATEEGQNLQAAISTATKATIALADETVKQSGNASDAIPIYTSYIEGLVGVASQAGFSQDQMAQLIAVMGMTPETIQTIMTLPGIDPEMAKLLQMGGMLSGLDGFVAQAGVNITVSIDTQLDTGAPGTHHDFGAQGGGVQKTPAQVAQKAVDDLLLNLAGNIPKTPGKKGGGGGGGGGGAPKWQPTAEQLANLQAALAAPFQELLTGDLGKAFQKQMADQWLESTTKTMLAEGKTRLGAGILEAGRVSGIDPTDELDKAATDYVRLSRLVGQANADAAAMMIDNLDTFSAYVDAIEAMIKHQQDVQDWKADHDQIDLRTYRAILLTRLAHTEAYTQEWMDLMDQVADVEDKMRQKEKDNLDEEKRIMEARLQLGEISKSDYLAYLRTQLAALAKYSVEWMALWQEISDLEKSIVDDQKDRTDAVNDFAKDVKRAFDDIKHSVEEPMLRATSLIAAFGDQTTVTADQVRAFYSHMLEGTGRWVEVIKQLKAGGINGAFLTELIQAGPQSLSFAEQILSMGAEGISMINTNMADIQALSEGLGTDIATGSVGTLNQTDNSMTITVGDVIITAEMPSGVTADEVGAAVTTALGQIAIQIGNRQTTGV